MGSESLSPGPLPLWEWCHIIPHKNSFILNFFLIRRTPGDVYPLTHVRKCLFIPFSSFFLFLKRTNWKCLRTLTSHIQVKKSWVVWRMIKRRAWITQTSLSEKEYDRVLQGHTEMRHRSVSETALFKKKKRKGRSIIVWQRQSWYFIAFCASLTVLRLNTVWLLIICFETATPLSPFCFST